MGGDRNRLYAKLHIAKKQIGLDDDAWRDLVERITASRSLKAATDDQLVALVEECRRIGFKPSYRPDGIKRFRLAGGKEHRKARALWLSLYHLGVIDNPAEQALTAFARRVTGGDAYAGIDALEWVRGDDINRVIEALKDWAAREGGVNWKPLSRSSRVDPRERVIVAQIRKLEARGVVVEGVFIPATAAEQDRLIADLGARLRAGGRKDEQS